MHLFTHSQWLRALLLCSSLAAPVLAHAQALLSGNQFLTPQLQAMQQDADANPVTLWIEKGQTLWSNSCQSCHNTPESLHAAAAHHPRLVTREGSARLVNLEDQINVCRQRVRPLETQRSAFSPTGKTDFEDVMKFGELHVR